MGAEFLTVRKRGPYPRTRNSLQEGFTILRLTTLALCALALGCASSSAKKAEVESVREELRALRQQNARLEQRVQDLEDGQAVALAARSGGGKSQKPRAKPEGPEEQPWEGDQVPSLTVVKLKPKANEPVPELPVETEIREPSDTHLSAMLDRAAPATEPEDEGSGEGPALPPEALEGLYARGLDALKTGNVTGGVLMLQDFAEQYPRHPSSDNALYFSGVGLAALGDHEGAANMYERVLSDYPAVDARMDAMLKLAEARTRLDQKDRAKALYEKLIQTWPGTAAATQAQQRLAQLTQ